MAVARRPAPVQPQPRASTSKASDDIIAALRADIASGRLPLASRLPTEADLAQHYGVSKPTVREAIRALDTMGLVEVRHGSGAFVRGDSAFLVTVALQVMMQLERVGIVEALDVRGTLGMQSARWAAASRTDDDLAALRQAYDDLDRLDATELDDVIDAIARFQEVIAAASHNALMSAVESVLIRILLQMQMKAMRARGVRFWQSRAQSFQPDRRAILDALVDRDVEAVSAAMRRYLDHQRELFLSDPALAQLVFSDPKALDTAAEMTAAMRRR